MVSSTGDGAGTDAAQSSVEATATTEDATPHQTMFGQREAAKKAFDVFERNAVQRFQDTAKREADDDDRVAYLLQHYGLRAYYESPTVYVLGRQNTRAPFIVALGALVQTYIGSDEMEPAQQRNLGLSYRLLPSGQVRVELVFPRPLKTIPEQAVALETLRDATKLTDRRVARHWRILRSYMQVNWIDGCPSWWTRQRVRWLNYSRWCCRPELTKASNATHYERVWSSSRLWEHTCTSGRWILQVGFSGALVIVAQTILGHYAAHPPAPTLAPEIRALDQHTHSDSQTLQREVAALRGEFSQLRRSDATPVAVPGEATHRVDAGKPPATTERARPEVTPGDTPQTVTPAPPGHA